MLGTQPHDPECKPIRRAFLFVWIILLLTSAAASGTTLLWGDPPVELPVKLRLEGTTPMVPVTLIDQFGGTVRTIDRVADVHVGGKSIRFEVGIARAVVNEREIGLPASPQADGDTLWVPLRTLAEHLLEARISYRKGDVHLVPWGAVTFGSPTVTASTVEMSESGSDGGSEYELEPEPEGASEPADHNVDGPRSEPSEGTTLPPEIPVADDALSESEEATEIGPAHVSGQEAAIAQAQKTENWSASAEDDKASDQDSGYDPVVDAGPITAPVPDLVTAGTHHLASMPQHAGFSLTRYARLQSPTRPRLRLRLPTAAAMPREITLPPIKPTALRAERMDWVEARLGQGPGGRDAVHISASKPFTYNTFLLTDPARLVIDVTGLDTGHAAEPLAVYGSNIQRIRMNQFSPNVVRLVIDLQDTVGYAVEEGPTGDEITIVLNHMLRSVRGQFDTFSGTVQLDLPRETDYRVLRLADPERLVIDLLDTTLSPDVQADLPAEGPVWNWRIQQFDPSTTRLVFEIERHLDIAALTHYDNLTFHIGHQVRGIGYAAVPDVGLVVHIAGAQLPDASVMYLVEPDRLVVDLPGTVLADPLLDTVIDQQLAWRIRTGQHPDMVRVVFDLVGAVEYEVVRLPTDQGLAVVMLPPSLVGRSVFLDPGHGAHDPGTMGRILGLMEKDIVLDVALRLRALLEEAGAKVFMSRSDDTFVEVNHRPVMARKAGTDVFLSIHVNAAPSGNDAGGTETFIYTRPNHPDNARFASAVHRHLVSAIGLTNRGVKQANFGVLRNSFIPSALVEIAFLSRREEEELLNEEWFRQLAAQGLFNGLVAYFNEGASRAAHLEPNELRRVEQGIMEVLGNDGFSYLPVSTEQEDRTVGAVRVQPLIGG